MKAVTRLADDAVRQLDLNDIARADGFLFVRDGIGFAGRGVALRVPFEDAPALLGSIDHTDETGLDTPPTGRGPIGIGWVPFEPGKPGEVVIPRVVVAKSRDGHCWVTQISSEGVDDGDETLAAPTPPTPSSAAASPSCSVAPATADACRHPSRRRRHRGARPQRHRPG